MKTTLDLHDLKKFDQPVSVNRTINLPNVAWNPWMDLKKRDDIKKLNIEFPFGTVFESFQDSLP